MMNSSPVFVIGSYRSGTSIFAWCLGQHPNIVNLPETNWLYRLAHELEGVYDYGVINGKYSHLSQMGLTRDEFFRDFGGLLDEYIHKTKSRLSGYNLSKTEGRTGFMRRRSEDEKKYRWVDATPENSHHVDALLRLFPDARFIHLLRNPDDVAASLMNFSRVGGSNRTMQRAYLTWYKLVRACRDAERSLPAQQILRVNYDDFIGDPEQTMARCLDFIDEEYDEQCIEPLERRINSSEVKPSEFKPGLITRSIAYPFARLARRLYRELLDNEYYLQDAKNDLAGSHDSLNVERS